jgi:hypothetical protein
MEESPEPPSLALRVIGGGEPTPEELAAVLVALTPASSEDEPEPTASSTPAWTRAAMLEGIGGRPAASPADLATSLPLA